MHNSDIFDDEFYKDELAELAKLEEEKEEMPTESDWQDMPYQEDFSQEIHYDYGVRMSGTIFEAGERVKVVGAMSGHQQAMGTILTVTGYNGQFVRVAENHLNFYEVDLQAMPYRLQDAERRFTKAEKEYFKSKSRLDYMKETGKKELSEEDFRQHSIKKIISDEKIPMDDKARLIQAICVPERG